MEFDLDRNIRPAYFLEIIRPKVLSQIDFRFGNAYIEEVKLLRRFHGLYNPQGTMHNLR